MKIIDLRTASHHIPTLAQWHHDEWSYLNPGGSVEKRIEKMQTYLGESLIPTMLIAVEDEEVWGTAALIASDMDTKPNLSPWLANVYVRADKRGLGVGAKLVKSIMDLAKQNQLPRIYLFTPDQENFYAKLGWKTLSKESYRNSPVTIMQLDFLGDDRHE
jgi:N-acetylglutamate synthase-like GNAT family acetyltransferase